MIEELKQIIQEIDKTSCDLNDNKADKILNLIFKSKSIFLSGEGRSGLMINALANRLTQIGLHTHVVTEITSPAISSEDLLIFNSASGTSDFLISQAKEAINQKVKIITFTSSSNSILSKKSNLIVTIDAQSKDENEGSIQPMGSLYEQMSLLLFDSLILKAIHKGLVTPTKLRATHSNLE